MPRPNDITNGTVTVTLSSTDGCAVVSDNMIITITPAPVVDAGIDQTVCETSPATTLSGDVTGGATTGQWSTSGDGSFDDNTNLNAIYTPGPNDISNGSVTLTLTSTGNGNCLAVSDQMTITITPTPIVSAGSDTTVCASDNVINLSGSVTVGSTTGQWSTSGDGIFSNNTDLNGTYTLGTNDIANGSVTITLTATNACAPISDNFVITITPIPIVNAGADQSICQTTSNINLSGSITVGGSAGQWTTSGDGSFSNDTDLNGTYTPGTNDISSGIVNIILTSTDGCSNVSDTFTLDVTTVPIVDAGSDQTLCSNNDTVDLSGSVTGSTTTGIWSTSGSGNFLPDNTTLTGQYIPSNADTSNGSVTLTLTSTNNGACPATSNSMTVMLTPAPIVDAGPDVFVCANNANVNLSGYVGGNTSTGLWTTNGSGTFLPNDSDLNATYIPSNLDTANGTVIILLTSTNYGNCIPVSDSLVVTITPAPIVIAGPDQYICMSDSAYLNGQILQGASTGMWTTLGTGNFIPDANTLNAIYVPGSADTLAGSVQLVLESTNNNGCNIVYDTLLLTFTPRPVVDAGPDQTICANSTADISGSITGSSTTGQWSTSGTGTFSPSDTSLNATYYPSPSDGTAGSVILTLVSTNACASSDQLTLTLTPQPQVNAGSDITICETQNAVSLNGTISGVTTTGIWTSLGSGSFSPNDSLLTATYNLSNSDSISGIIPIILTSTNNGNCAAESDTLNIFLTRQAVVDAGLDVFTCSNNPIVDLSGSISGGTTTGYWSSSGSGTFSPDINSLIASYNSTPSDTAAGNIILTLTSTNNGACNAVSDNLTVTFTPSPWVNAGNDASVCANNAAYNLLGSITGGASQGIWTTNGTGIFSPSDSVLNTTYIPSPDDTANGQVVLTLTSTDNGNCITVSDSMVLTITDAPLVNAGPDIVICNDENASLNGSVSSISGEGEWSTLGDGSFSDIHDLYADYFPGVNDSINGTVSVVLISINTGNCSTVSDTLNISLTPRPFVDAGTDQTICANTSVILSGTVSGSSTTGYWTTSGTGIFIPDSTNLNAEYIPSNEDTAAGQVILMLTSNNACASTDSLNIILTPAPQVDAGPDQIICTSVDTVNLSGNVFGATNTGIWSTTGTGIFTPNDSTLNPIYSVSSTDSLSGEVYLVLTSTNNGYCNAESDSVHISITDIPSVDAGSDQVVCANNPVSLSGTIIGTVTDGVWSTNGSGTFVPDSTNLNATYIFSNADTATDSVTLVLSSVGSCELVTDTVNITITPAPQVNAGIDVSVCANNPDVTLVGSVWGSTSTGQWTTTGSGTFAPSDTDLTTIYIPSNADTAAGSVVLTLSATNIGTCLPVSNSITITYTDPPIADAGNDLYVCNDSYAQLYGNIIGGGQTGAWTTNGTGSFSPADTTLNAVYNPSPGDTTAGSIQMILTSTNNGGCNPVSDTITIFFTPRPYVNAGTDLTICENDTAFLSGTVSGSSTTGFWTSDGLGTFLPDSSDLNAYYLPDTANAGDTLNIILTSSNTCASNDTISLIIMQAPIVDAGPNQTICPDQTSVNLNGTISGETSTGQWTTLGTGTFVPNDTTLNATYYLSYDDSVAGIVTLLLSSTGAGYCSNTTDTMVVTISDHPTVDAGTNIIACANNIVQLAGTSTGVSNWWTTSGSGTFAPDSNDLNATYVFSNADTSSGSIYLTLNSSNNCGQASDSLQITITPAPYVYAGENLTVCNNSPNVQLNGVVSGGSLTGEWSGSGSGIFTPSNQDLNAVYIPDNTDTINGSVTLTLTSTNNGNCLSVSDSIIVTFNPAPIVFAGNDITVCNGNIVHLNGTISSASGTGIWTTLGSGTFSPSDTVLNGDYIASTADTVNGFVQLILEATNLGNCFAEPDTVTAYFLFSSSVADAGQDRSICNGDSVLIIPSIQGGTGTVHWYSSGGGSFYPSDSAFNLYYIPAASDIDSNNIFIYMDYHYVCGSLLDSIQLFINPVPDAGFIATWNCNNMQIVFNDTTELTSGNISNWSWDLGDGNYESGESFIHTYSVAGDYDISLVVSSDSGCIDSTFSTIHVWEPIYANFSVSDTIAVPGQLLHFYDESVGATSWSWSFGVNGATSEEQNPDYTYNNFGDYTVWLLIEADNSCKDSVSQVIHMMQNGVVIPTGFSPNNDGLNDVFYVRGGPFSEYELRVFNDWGQQIFISTDLSVGWDGTYKNKNQQEGVYVYIFKGVTINGEKIERTGNITLIR